MSDHLFQIDNDTIKILGISIPIILVAGYLAAKLLDSILKRQDGEYNDFKAARDKFTGHFTDYIQSLTSEDCGLNYLISTEFRSHELAMLAFVPHLGRFRKSRFMKVWNQYAAIYQEINNLGPLGLGASIAPSVEALNNARPGDAHIWDRQRRQQLLQIIHKLLHISQKNGWF